MINRKSLIKLLQRKPGIEWLDGKYPDKRPLKWVYVCPFLTKEWNIGISENGYWVSENNGILSEVIEEKTAFTMAALLESALKDVIKTIKHGLTNKDIPLKVFYTFPWDALLLSAIKYGGYWKKHALEWVKDGYPISERMILLMCENDLESEIYKRWQSERLKSAFGI